MDYLQQIDPWQHTKATASQSYRVQGSLFTVPFVLHDSASKTAELTSIKSNDEFFEQFRQLPEDFFAIFDEKRADSLELNPPVKLTDLEMEVYFRESSSQHMSTLLDGVEAAGLKLVNADILITSETLNRIAGTVFQPQNSWRLRASVEYVYGKNVIVICDDDMEEEAPPTPSIQFFRERLDALVLAQSICESHRTNKLLHGAHAVESVICDGEEKIRMVVLGEVDLIVDKQPVNTFVSTGIGRSNRVALGSNHDVLNTCYEYLWSRSFWLGIGHSLFGMRASDDGDVQFIQRFSLTDFFRQHRHRNNKLADVATNCVARVLINLKKAILTNPRQNWILNYDGRSEDVEPAFVTIQKASESWSFLLIREKFHMIKREVGKLQNAPAPAHIEMPYPKTRKVFFFGRTSSIFSDEEPIVVLGPTMKYKPEERVKKRSNWRKNEPPMMIMIKIEQRRLKNQSIDIQNNDTNNDLDAFKTEEFELLEKQQTPRRFHTISESVEHLKKDEDVEYIPFLPTILENVENILEIQKIQELTKDKDVEYIPFIPLIPEILENILEVQLAKDEDVEYFPFLPTISENQNVEDIVEIKTIQELTKDEDVEYVPFVACSSEDVGIQKMKNVTTVQNRNQNKMNRKSSKEKYEILSRTMDIESIPFFIKAQRAPLFYGPELPPPKRKKEKKSKRSHSEKEEYNRYEREDKKRRNDEKERKKSLKRQREESPIFDFQRHQRPLLKQSVSYPEKYQEKEYERSSLRYREPPQKDRRNEHQIPVNVRTVTADSRSSTVYRRH